MKRNWDLGDYTNLEIGARKNSGMYNNVINCDKGTDFGIFWCTFQRNILRIDLV